MIWSMGNPRRQVLVDLSQIQQAHAGHAPVLAGGLGGGQVLGKRVAGWCPAVSGKSQMVDLPLTLAGHDLWRLVNQGGQDGASLGFGAPFAFAKHQELFHRVDPDHIHLCSARPDTSYLID